MSQNSIGTFQVLEIIGVPDTVAHQLEMVMRPGVLGLGFWDTGKRGRPFQVETRVDAADLAQARSFFENYTRLVGRAPVNIIWRGIDLSTYLIRFQVLEVRAIDIRSLAAASGGGLNPPSLGWCHCAWTLVAVSESETATN